MNRAPGQYVLDQIADKKRIRSVTWCLVRGLIMAAASLAFGLRSDSPPNVLFFVALGGVLLVVSLIIVCLLGKLKVQAKYIKRVGLTGLILDLMACVYTML